MTREQKDKLQKELDRYAERRSKVKDERKLSLLKMTFGMRLSRLIPDMKVAGIDVSLMLGPIAALFAPKNMGPVTVPVVEGHSEAWSKIEEEYGTRGSIPLAVEEAFEKEYALSIPGDLAIEAMRIKTSNRIADLAFGKYGDGGNGTES
jgi:hypothetical protein